MPMTSVAVSAFIVDDQPVFRLGLRAALEQAGDLKVLGDCSLSHEAVGLVSRFQPGLVLVGTTPQSHRGLDICRRIGECCPGMPVIIMTPAEDSGELVEAIRNGAWGYVSKLADVHTILRVIRKACRGEMPLQDTVAAKPEVGRRVLQEFQAMSRNPRLRDVMAPLSPREMELLRHLGQGRSNKEIAHLLNITPQTVKNHITTILRKLDVNDRTQAVLAGLRHGWLTLDDSESNADDLGASAPTGLKAG